MYGAVSWVRVGSPNGSRPMFPTVQSPKVKWCSGRGVYESLLISGSRWSVAGVDPGALAPALDRLVNEVDPARALLHRREVRIELAGLLPRDLRGHRPRRVQI